MKVSDYHFLSLLLPAALSGQTQVPIDPNCCGNDPEGTVLEIRQQASSEIINARRSAINHGYGAVKVAEKVDIKTEKVSFLAGSEFLLGAKGFTIVPKGSAVTPSRGLKILSEPPSEEKLQSWQDFQRSNPSAVRLLPVTEAMLNGEPSSIKSILERISFLKTGGIAYVTTLNGNPVSLPGLTTIKPQ